MIQHYLEFISSGHGIKEILEPGKFKDAQFLIQQPDGRLGRDAQALGAGKVALELYSFQPDHCFDLMMYNNNTFGFQAKVLYHLHIDGLLAYTGQVDFATMETDESTYVEFSVLEVTTKQLFKRRDDVNTNLFSHTSLNDTPITPVTTQKVLVKAKPVVEVSTWEQQTQPLVRQFVGFGQDGAFIAPFPNLINYDIGNSFAPFSEYTVLQYFFSDEEIMQVRDEMTVIRAQTNLMDVKIKLKGINLRVDSSGQIGNIRTAITIGYGTNYEAGQHNIITLFEGGGEVAIDNQDYEATIPFLNNTSFIYVWVSVFQRDPGFGPSTGISNSRITYSGVGMEITATEVAYNTVVPMVRLVDAMRYNALSSANLPIIAPRWEFGGELYDQWITTQPLMRNLTDKAFNISTKDITEGYMPEVFGDFQILDDGTVYYGVYSDFYKDYQIANFSQSNVSSQFGQPTGQLVGYKKTQNQPYLINNFKYKYSNYQSKKESEVANSYDLVHGETEWYNQNTEVENTKAVEVDFIRDAFLIEESRRKAYDLSDSSATQDDDKIYIFDVVPLTNADRTFTETSVVNHVATGSSPFLVLKNNQSFSWVLLGIGVGSTFVVNTGGANTGTYTVISVTDDSIKLEAAAGFPQNLSFVNTTFTYSIGDDVTLVNRTNEGFESIENIADGDNYSNLRFTPKRNILNYYAPYLSSCNEWLANKEFKNSLYKNNPLAKTRLIGDTDVVEGDNFVPEGRILTSFIYDAKILMTLQDFLLLMQRQKQYNGYITTFDEHNLPLKGYIKKATWVFENETLGRAADYVGVCSVTLEERYQPFYVYIFGSGNGSIILNDTISAVSFDVDIDDLGKLHIFDGTGKLMYPPVPFDRVKVNNSGQATSALQLKQWLNQL